MGNLFGMFENRDDKKEISDKTEFVEAGKLLLREEELDISKDRVPTGEVNLRKEVVEEQKTINVPVTHEEVVIERRAINNEPSDAPVGSEETIRIPVSEEKVEVGKHTVITGEISAHKREVEEMEQVAETLKREEARVEKSGDPNMVSDEEIRDLH